jgi:hypothetical protein
MSKKTDKEKLPNLFVGQVLYYPIGQTDDETYIAETQVVKVCRDYFYAEIGGRKVRCSKIHMWCYDTDIKLYTSKQDIIGIINFDCISSRIQQHFDLDGAYTKNTLDQLRQVAKILGIEYPEII